LLMRVNGAGSAARLPSRRLQVDSSVILKTAAAMLEGLFREGFEYRKAGVMLSGMVPRDQPGTTMLLFEEEPGRGPRHEADGGDG